MPDRLEPMLATSGDMPADQSAYAFEFKWDGVRAMCFHTRSNTTFQSRNLLDITLRYPEITGIGPALGRRQAILDGEIIALDPRGRPSFSLLQTRAQANAVLPGSRRARVPVIYMVFDVLFLDGRWTTSLPFTARHEMLQELLGGHQSGPWRVSTAYPGEGTALIDAARLVGLEGIMAKRLESHYAPGRRTGDWLKIKLRRGQEFVVAGYTVGDKSFKGTLGALLLGYYERPARRRTSPPRLVYAGSVGSGFTIEQRAEILRALAPLGLDASPFDEPVPKRGAVFVEPRLVAEIEFAEWTHENILRQPSFKGFRLDKAPHQVVREPDSHA
ncbi:MAG: DNA ligase [Phycisphaerales bacterium]|nr:DNA ligase [Phycisphaerales bacterium]